MTQVKLKPTLRKQGKILYSGDIKSLEQGQSCIAISQMGSKKYSFLVQVLEVEKTPIDQGFDDIPVLEVDKYLSGILSENDIVELYPYNLPEAQRILIGISNKYMTITPGNWTATLKDSLIDKPFDLANDVKTAITVDKGLLILRGTIIDAYPELPAFVGPATQIIIQKFPEHDLENRKMILEREKAKRVDQLKDVIQQDTAALIARAKANQLKSANESLDFGTLDPYILDKSISGFFGGYELYDQQLVNDPNGFSSFRSYVVRDQGSPKEIIEYQIQSAAGHGTVIARVYSENISRAQTLVNQLWQNIQCLMQGLGLRPKNILNKCPSCGGSLRTDGDNNIIVSDEGLVTCAFCRSKSSVQYEY